MVKELDWLHLYGDLWATYVLGDYFLSVTTLRKSTYESVCRLRRGMSPREDLAGGGNRRSINALGHTN